MEKNTGTGKLLVGRLSKFVNAQSKKHGEKQKALDGMALALSIKSTNLVYYWMGQQRVPGYHEKALDAFLTEKGY